MLIGDPKNDHNIVFTDDRWPDFRIYKREGDDSYYVAHRGYLDIDHGKASWHHVWDRGKEHHSCGSCRRSRCPEVFIKLARLLNL